MLVTAGKRPREWGTSEGPNQPGPVQVMRDGVFADHGLVSTRLRRNISGYAVISLHIRSAGKSAL
jgi:hypothetical protein